MPKSMEKEQSKIDKTNLSMPAPVQAKMEQSFGTNFSNVNFVESNTVADYGAQAVTQGNTVAFAPGHFNPSTYEGQSLIGHELSHVVSQAKGEVHAPQGKGLNFVADARLEAKADNEGHMAASGQKIYGSQGTVISSMSEKNMPVQGKLPWKKHGTKSKKNGKEALIKKASALANKQAPKEIYGEKDFSEAALAHKFDELMLQGDNVVIAGADIFFSDAKFGEKIREGAKRFRENKDAIRANQSEKANVKDYDSAIEAEGANWIQENLTAEEFLLLIDYTDSEYTNYNSVLRNPESFDPKTRDSYLSKTKKLEGAIRKYKNPKRRTLYRGITNRKNIKFLIGQDKYQPIENELDNLKQSGTVKDPFAASLGERKIMCDTYDEKLQGAAFIDKGFGSATYNLPVARGFAQHPSIGLLFEIDYPEGLSFAPIGTTFSANPSESELLLPPSTVMIFEKAEINHGGYIVFKTKAIDANSEGIKK